MESDTGLFYNESCSTYVSHLRADSAANPGNTVLATAIANPPDGNDANGNSQIALAAAQLTMLGLPRSDNALVNINSNGGSPSNAP